MPRDSSRAIGGRLVGRGVLGGPETSEHGGDYTGGYLFRHALSCVFLLELHLFAEHVGVRGLCALGIRPRHRAFAANGVLPAFVCDWGGGYVGHQTTQARVQRDLALESVRP